MLYRTASKRVLSVLRLHGGAVSALDLMDCTGIGPGRLYPTLARMRDENLLVGVQHGKGVRYRATAWESPRR